MAEACSSADSEEIEEIASSIAHDLGHLQWSNDNPDDKSSSCQIHKVHQLVRQIDSFAYEPFVLSIGPYHHNNASLQFMEKLKWRCLDYILKLNCRKSLRDYLVAIIHIENEARACYSSDIKLDSESFRRMLLLDGCFTLVYLGATHGVSQITEAAPGPSVISDDSLNGKEYVAQQTNECPKNSAKSSLDTVQEIEITIVNANTQNSENKDSTNCHDNSGVEWYHIFALPDLFLLENQIPFFVVRALYEVLVGPDKENSLTESISYYIEGNLQYMTGALGTFKKPNDFCHLLHLFHMHFTPRIVQQECNHLCPRHGDNFLDKFCKFFSNINSGFRQDELSSSHNKQFDSLQSGKVTRWRRATQYHESGIVFKRKEFDGRNSHSLLDVMFHDGVLEIPCLYIDDISGSFLRNLIAFEQTNPHFGNSVTAYIMFMSQLISRPDDVTLLSQRGIIMHHLHSDMVVSILFTRLTKGVVFDFMGNFYLRTICWKMEMYYQNRINRWVAWLKHNHLSNPWLGLALLAGLLVLACTIVQTVLTVLAYMGP